MELNIFLGRKEDVKEVRQTILDSISETGIILFTKYEFLAALLEMQNDQSQQGTSLFQFLIDRQNKSNPLIFAFLDHDQIEKYIPIISKYHNALSVCNVHFEGLQSMIKKYQALEDAIVIAQYSQRWQLYSANSLIEKMKQQYQNKKVIIEVDYKLLRMFFCKFMHDKQFFLNLFCIVRVVCLDRNFYADGLGFKEKKRMISQKYGKFLAFLVRSEDRDYRIKVEQQILSDDEIQFMNDNNITQEDIMKQHSLFVSRLYELDSKVLQDYHFANISGASSKFDNDTYFKYFYYSIKEIKHFQLTQLKFNLQKLVRLLLITKKVKHLELKFDFLSTYFKPLYLQDSSYKPLIDALNYLFSQNTIEKTTFKTSYNIYSDDNFNFLSAFEFLPRKVLLLNEMPQQIKIIINQANDLYHCQIIDPFNASFTLEAAAFQKQYLSLHLNSYCTPFLRTIISEKISNIIEVSSQDTPPLLSTHYTDQIMQSFTYFREITFFKMAQVKFDEFKNMFENILKQNEQLQVLKIQAWLSLKDLCSSIQNDELIISIKERCPNLKQLEMNLDNSEQIKDLIEHYNYKLLIKDKSFSIQKIEKELQTHSDVPILKFVINSSDILLFEQVFHKYKDQFSQASKIAAKSEFENHINPQLQKEDKMINPIKFQLNLSIEKKGHISKVANIMTNLLNQIDYVNINYQDQNIFTKEDETYSINCVNEDMIFFHQFLPKQIKKLVIHEYYGESFFLMLKLLARECIEIDCLQINMAMIVMSQQDNINDILKQINYKYLIVKLDYQQITQENLIRIYSSIQQNLFFSDSKAIEKTINFQFRFDSFSINQYKNVFEVIKMLSTLQDNQYIVKGKYSGRNNYKLLTKYQFKEVFNENSFYQRMYTSFKCMRKYNKQFGYFREDILSHICSFY